MAEYSNDMFGLQQQMKNEQAAKEQAAINNAVNLAGTPRASMLANTIDIAENQGNAYANLGRMLSGEGAPVDPRVEKMQKLQAIENQMPDPQTEQDYLKLAQMLRAANLPGEAQKAMEMVNSIRSAASTAAKATFQDVNGATRYKATGLLVKGESEIKTTTPTELSLDQLFTDTVERDPAYIAAVKAGDVPAQQKIIATAKRSLKLSDDISNQQVQQFTVDSLDQDGNTVYSDVWRSYNKTTNKWEDLQSTAQQMKAAVTRTYVDDTDKGKFSITEEFVNGDFVEIARTNVDDIPNSFEQAAVMGVLNSPGYADLSKADQSNLLIEAKKSISIPTTESAVQAAYRDVANDFIEQEKTTASINGVEDFNAVGTTNGNKRFLEWKNQLATDVAAAGGNTSISDVLGQYKLWNNISTNSRNGLDQLTNLKNQIADARGTKPGSEQNAASWAVATRTIVSLTKDSNLSLAEVQTVSKAGSVPRKISNYLNQAITGIPVEASIEEFEQIARGLETVLINRYNTDHSNFNKSFAIAGTDNALLKSMTGEPIIQEVSARAATTEEIYEALVQKGVYTFKDGIYYDESGTAIME